VDPIYPISPDRAVQPVELKRLSPLEREQERQRRERERQRRQTAPKPRENGSDEPNSGIDVRV
jgi:hypothetical protein